MAVFVMPDLAAALARDFFHDDLFFNYALFHDLGFGLLAAHGSARAAANGRAENRAFFAAEFTADGCARSATHRAANDRAAVRCLRQAHGRQQAAQNEKLFHTGLPLFDASGLCSAFHSKTVHSYRRSVLMNPQKRHEFFRRLAELDPEPKTELEYNTPFELLTAVLLSAQATDVGVNKATRKLFPVANTPETILALGQDGLESYIATIGLYRSKAKHLLETCRILIERHGSQVPHDRAALEALPGVGRKTANVVLNIAFGEPTLAVDTHIFRLGNRTGLAPARMCSKSSTSCSKSCRKNFCSTLTTG
jgi:endonuclease III